ncbi:hypothetical protein CAC42_7491 [Sphaceloma murrayae]|uniref:Uncharacterized protein n=1 Tax=Sphaceloma murrayae TaxID=2082308 RepID=A0A2K1QX70_9PEZI|nr:hypothetical protein CAC42_7491 [Sphaceloma murrayae]
MSTSKSHAPKSSVDIGSDFAWQKPAGSRPRRNAQAYRLLAIFSAILFGGLILSQALPTQEPASKSLGNASPGVSGSAHKAWFPGGSHRHSPAAAFYESQNVSSPEPMINAILHPERRSVSSPNKLWRFRLADDGELVLERSIHDKWSPVWWPHSSTYKKRGENIRHRYMTLDGKGAARVISVTRKEDSLRHELSWDSRRYIGCAGKLNNNTAPLTKELGSTILPQSLLLDDSGRLAIFDATAKTSCLLYEGTASEFRPWLATRVDMEYDIEYPDAVNDDWPAFTNSDMLLQLQLRAMLHQDLVRTNRSLELSARQLETTFNTAIVIPSYHGHLEYLHKFLRQVEQWQINVVVLDEDLKLFRNTLFNSSAGYIESVAFWLPGLRLIEFEKMHFEHYRPSVDVGRAIKKQHKTLIQDFKKNHGCLVTGKRYCSMQDSESIVIRTTVYADYVQEYLDNPFIIHNPDGRNGKGSFYVFFSEPLRDLFGMPQKDFVKLGWTLEYYCWIFDSTVYTQVAKLVAEKYPLATGSPQEWFTEIAYFFYVWMKKTPIPGPTHKWITAEELIGERVYNMTWNRVMRDEPQKSDGLAIIEDVRAWMHWFPGSLVPIAEQWNKRNLRLYKASDDWWQSMAFLSIAKGVVMCVSEQPRELYEAAMWGHLNH